METLVIPLVISIVSAVAVLFVEYFYFQPLIKSKNPRAQIKEHVRIIVDFVKSIFHFIVPLFKKLINPLAQGFAYGLVILIFTATFSFNFVIQYASSNISTIQNWLGSQLSSNALISGILIAIYFLATIMLGSLESGIRKISQLVITVCCAVILVNIFAPDFLFQNEVVIKQSLLKFIAIALATIWGVALILLEEYRKQYENIDNSIAFLKGIPQISVLIENESSQLIKRIQQGWLSFIDNPWADDYISSIKDCVPFKCNGYLLTIGYLTDRESLILDSVKNALEEDMQNFFKIPRLKLYFEKIDKQQHKTLVSLLNGLDDKGSNIRNKKKKQ